MGHCCGGTGAVDAATPRKGGLATGAPAAPGRLTVKVYSETEALRAIENHPGYSVTRASFGPTTTVLTFTPKAR